MTTRTTEQWPGTGTTLRFVRVQGLAPGSALSPDEEQRYSAFRLEKRRSEWLAGRLAAKFLLAETDGTDNLSSYEIVSDALGRPSCGGRLLSISHSNGWALAAFKPGGSSFLGADLEKTEPRHPAWYRDYFHKTELPGADPSEGTRLWTIKEALMKALGLGLMADPLDIHAGGEIKLTGRPLKRYKELGSPEFTVETRAWPEGFWTAVAAGK
ncbi:MAG: hypothetical protein COT18_00275 [Elusimicrobia bacterium CG08_land_8_20_14_0_20_59_10]|nr:MAG: hypothetical protein COT18_00275 [Elusimicrobia bacterium CG08_land_8_20_14_0_20_59_10]